MEEEATQVAEAIRAEEDGRKRFLEEQRERNKKVPEEVIISRLHFPVDEHQGLQLQSLKKVLTYSIIREEIKNKRCSGMLGSSCELKHKMIT